MYAICDVVCSKLNFFSQGRAVEATAVEVGGKNTFVIHASALVANSRYEAGLTAATKQTLAMYSAVSIQGGCGRGEEGDLLAG
uniref:Uncharacterized protein n=1 Tax=Leersia perrieri TaxID=77586 RepID=A0A0D9X978_9ORYZ